MHGLMGFFRYNPFPFVVCFEIEKFDEKGRAYVHQIGWFTPDQILTIRPIEAGQEIRQIIESLHEEHRRRQKEITDELCRKIEEMLGVPLKR